MANTRPRGISTFCQYPAILYLICCSADTTSTRCTSAALLLPLPSFCLYFNVGFLRGRCRDQFLSTNTVIVYIVATVQMTRLLDVRTQSVRVCKMSCSLLEPQGAFNPKVKVEVGKRAFTQSQVYKKLTGCHTCWRADGSKLDTEDGGLCILETVTTNQRSCLVFLHVASW